MDAPQATSTPIAEQVGALLREAHLKQQDDLRQMHRAQQEDLQRASQQIKAQQQDLNQAAQQHQAQATRLDQLGNHLASQFTAMQEALTQQLSEQPADRPRKARSSTVLPPQSQGVYVEQAGVPRVQSPSGRWKAPPAMPPPPASLTQVGVPPAPGSSASMDSWVIPLSQAPEEVAQPSFQGQGPESHTLATPRVSDGEMDEALETQFDSDTDVLGPPQLNGGM